MIIILDGPEAAGKSTLVTAIERLAIVDTIRRWGPVESWAEYLPHLKQDLLRPVKDVIIWDRSWAAEVCYNELMERGRNINEHAIAAELERPLTGQGLCFMILTNVEDLTIRRAERRRARGKPDLACRPRNERDRFEQYAIDHEWQILASGSESSPAATARVILMQTRQAVGLEPLES